jgi:hypothetical protein
MARLFVCDNSGWVTVDIEASGPVMAAALEHDKAEPLIRCAVFMALSALAEGDGWPTALLQSMAGFMSGMMDEVRSQQLM